LQWRLSGVAMDEQQPIAEQTQPKIESPQPPLPGASPQVEATPQTEKPQAQAQPAATAEEPHKRKHTKGEKWFDRSVYGGINWAVNFLVTVPVAFELKYGRGAKYFEAAAHKLAKTGMSEHKIEQALLTTCAMQGGNILVLPIKWAENKKVQIVGKLNKWFGEPDVTEEIKKEPQQSWGSLIKSRLMAWGTIFLSIETVARTFGKDAFEGFQNKFSKHIVCDPLKFDTHTMQKNAEGVLEKVETKAFRYGKIAAVDIFATTAAAVIFYVASRFFAKKKQHKQEADTVAPAAPPSTEMQFENHQKDAERSFTQQVDERGVRPADVARAPKLVDGFAHAVTQQELAPAALSV
jgi:hypothetical protein